MFNPTEYQLLDFGKGEKLENFAGKIVRRETPSVDARTSRDKDVNWDFDLRFQNVSPVGGWRGSAPPDWQIGHGAATFLLKPTPAGQLGVFPEQATNWDWIEASPIDFKGLKALNLFGYTGGTTMVLAARGASVVHVDSARNVMKWARANAAAAGLTDAAIRWIVEDALTFVQRESKRGSKYDILIADPPSYGKGTKKEHWKFSDQIGELMIGLAEIAAPNLKMLLLSCHTPGFDESSLSQLVSAHFDVEDGMLDAFELKLHTASGRSLPSGHCCRFSIQSKGAR